jgi:tetratricopeptide (TPR) repeat protein/TolB-like protein
MKRLLNAVSILSLCFYLASRIAVAQTSGSDTVLVLPFENTSNFKEYNWIGESFVDALSELLSVPGLRVVSSDERELIYQRLRLPLTVIPTRATAIKIGREAQATLVVYGTYRVTPVQGENAPAEIQGTARVIRVNEGRLMGEQLADGRWASQQFDFGGPLKTLQAMQGRLAYQILYQRDKAFPFSLNQFIERATKVPARAFESYVKGTLTTDPEKKKAYLQNALLEYARVNGGATYTQAAFELGQFYFERQDWKEAAEYLSRLQKRDRHYAEAAFYAAIAYWRMNDLTRALGALLPLTTETRMKSVYNNAGAISIQAARSEAKVEERDRLLKQGAALLQRASESAPEDPLVRFNYAYALLLLGKYAEAADQLRPVITANPRDGEALFLFAKALEKMGKAEAANSADNESRRFLTTYARWQTEWLRSQTLNQVPLRLYQNFNRFDYYDAARDRLAQDEGTNVDAKNLLAKARELYAAGRDDEALPELRRALTIEPMSAEAYLILGYIHQRRGDLDAAVSALRTAIFWNPRLIEAHIALGRIFLDRGDRAQAMTYAKNALQIDPNNPEAIALQRQVETGIK